MNHLHTENIIHCDLAARNLLCIKQTDRIVVKVSDFGLSKISETGTYDASKFFFLKKKNKYKQKIFF